MNTIETNEILEMREQLASLKKRLENQEIVNERMIRETMSHKLSTLHRRAMALCAVSFIGIPAVLSTTHNLGCSIVFACVTIALILVGVVAQFLTHYRIGRDTLTGDLITTYNEVARMKRIYQRWLYFSMPLFVAWLGWGAYEIYTNVSHDESQLYAAIIGTVVGLVLGLIFGLRQHRENIRTAKDIMRQIEALKAQK